MIVLFRGTYSFLSNYFDYCPVSYEGLTYRNSEAAYQAAKAVNPEDRKMFCNVDPDTAKAFGKTVKLRPDWDDVKADVMRAVVRTKFTQHPELTNWLISTGDEELVEGNYWHDNFFGDCRCPACRDNPGLNMLGKILMEEREHQKELRGDIHG